MKCVSKSLVRARLLPLALVFLFLATAAFSGEVPVVGFPTGGQDPASLDGGLAAGAYGYHPMDDGSWGESWSIQAHNDAGDFLYVLMSVSNYNPFHKFGATVDLFYYPATGQKCEAHGEYKASTVNAAREGVRVNIDGNVFSGKHPTYTLKAKVKDVAFDLTFTVDTPDLRLGGDFLRFGKTRERFWNLTVLAPRSSVRGTIVSAGKTMDFAGRAYIDHGWSNEKIYEFSKRWYVLRSLEGDFSFNAIRMIFRDDYEPGETSAIYITLGDKVIANSGGVTIKPTGAKKHEESDLDLPASYELFYDNGDVRLTGTVTMTRLGEAINVLGRLSPLVRGLIKALVTDPWQFRFEAVADLTLTVGDQTRKINAPVIGEVHHYK